MPTRLSDEESAMIDGARGEAPALAMRVITRVADVMGAPRLIPVTRAHIDGCLYHGRAGLDFAERLADAGGRVALPTTLNVSSLDLLHPELIRADEELRGPARRLMDAYVAMGCEPTWTCSPYQLPTRPSLGEQVAWAESNAIVFANSVLGARTERYGDFMDISAAIAGRVPDAGFHREENRRGSVVFDLSELPPALLAADAFYAVLGHLVGAETGTAVPVIEGLPDDVSEDRLKALGAAAASSGSVAMFHAVGITPEARTMEYALGGEAPERTLRITAGEVAAARDDLSTAGGDRLDAVSVGTPHFSRSEIGDLAALLDGEPPLRVPFYVSTSRSVLETAGDRVSVLEAAGATLVTDTCTYVTPILDPGVRVVMTNSAKWAYYGPGNLGVSAVFGSLEECVRSARLGRVVRDDGLWGA